MQRGTTYRNTIMLWRGTHTIQYLLPLHYCTCSCVSPDTFLFDCFVFKALVPMAVLSLSFLSPTQTSLSLSFFARANNVFVVNNCAARVRLQCPVVGIVVWPFVPFEWILAGYFHLARIAFWNATHNFKTPPLPLQQDSETAMLKQLWFFAVCYG